MLVRHVAQVTYSLILILVLSDQGTLVTGSCLLQVIAITTMHDSLATGKASDPRGGGIAWLSAKDIRCVGKDWRGLGKEGVGLGKFNTDACSEICRLDWASTSKTCSRA